MSFGANDFVKLYDDFGTTDSFDLVPAIRHPSGSCVDEQGCDYEKWTLCAFNMTMTKHQVAFLACMDDKQGEAKDAAKACASKGSLHFDAMEDCFNSPGLADLVKAASDAFNKRLPGSTTIPHTFVNEKDTQPSYSSLKKALCDAGSTASACGHAGEAATAKACTV